MIGYRILSLAEKEISNAVTFYEEAATGLGSEFVDDLERTINRAREHPGIGQNISQHLQRILFSRFPFSLNYTVDNNEILVIAVAHQHRQPNYWKQRID